MNNLKLPKNITLLLLSLLVILSCSKNDDTTTIIEAEQHQEKQTDSSEETEEIATEVEEITLLTAAEYIQSEADVTISATALKGTNNELEKILAAADSKLTFFVPSNEAFTNFLTSLKDYSNILDFDEAIEKEILAEILKYHTVIDNANFLSDITSVQLLETLQSEALQINIENGVTLQDATNQAATITKSDIEVANGVIHIIDKVLLPKLVLTKLARTLSLIDLLHETDEFSLFAQAITKANLTERFDQGDYTIFTPTNAAIEKLFEILGDGYNSFNDFNNPLELEALNEIILGHVVEKSITRSELKAGKLATLIPNDFIEVSEGAAGVILQDATEENTNFIEFDFEASNGTIHSIDKILIPKKVLQFVY
ncbi:fasciclin domain-containing protein [Aurantibacter crassamenti]|uniref:fasciclin domain-containing protein n=1 Tax=Aurantibacter crassamenti TaxID=1837375 RepID=UPI0019396B2F|nr:fasciclin domain-containing protein [Aurantibacter crassamenti]MBM1104666.1 fasciclin domain-containing protein [Aurantibacter crassamenti]